MVNQGLSTTRRLKLVYEKGLNIIESRDLYSVWESIPKHDQKSFDEFARQNMSPDIYKEWWQLLQEEFSKSSLNFLKIKRKSLKVTDIRNNSIGHASRLVKALNELERMIEDKDYLNTYMIEGRDVHSWSVINFNNDTVTQGASNFHRFTDPDAQKMLSILWESRAILKPYDKLKNTDGATGWEKLPWKIERAKGIAQAINKSMRQKNISLRVSHQKSLKGMLLIARQK